MGAPAQTTHWLPQDDLQLKNAVEAGASLKALAKGAVKFSRKFSLQEVRDRWHSLLYDVDLATEASQRMIEAEVSGSSLQSKKNEANGSPGKRKSESVRQCYYATRKRILNVPLESFEFDFLNDPFFTNFFLGDQLPNFEGIQEPNFGTDNKSLGHPGNTGATFMADGFPSMALNAGCCDKDNTFLGQSKFVQMSELGHSEEPQDPNFLHYVDLGDNLFPEFGGFVFDTSIPDCVASFQEDTGENVGLLDPTFGYKMMELPHDVVNQFQEQVTSGSFGNFASNCEQIARLSKYLLDYDEDDEQLLNEAGGNKTTDDWASLLSFEEIPNIPRAVPNEESPTMEKCRFENPTQICSAGTQKLSSALEVNPMHPELNNGVLCCTLNTEDTKIPGNDEVFPGNSRSVSWMEQTKSADIYYPVPFFADEFSCRSENFIRVEQTEEEGGCKFTDQNTDTIHAESGSKIDNALSDLEGFPNDGEVPYFSDVEEMINDMDLCPGDDIDVHRNPTVLEYQDDDARERIIRMEQAAKAATERYIAAHGAYAILYGRHSKYFIKKPEVVIGRGTEDVQVDICLGKESCASKVSRRQATLKLDNDGTFHLCNHGRFPIFVNGKEISLGQTSSLISGCLIEIRELAFIFETNEKSCKATAVQVH